MCKLNGSASWLLVFLIGRILGNLFLHLLYGLKRSVNNKNLLPIGYKCCSYSLHLFVRELKPKTAEKFRIFRFPGGQ